MAAAASFLKPFPALLSLLLISFSHSTLALPSCNGPCSDLNDLNDDCKPTGSMTCDGQTYRPTYTCSPPIYSSTTAILTLNDFTEGGDGGGPSKCDGSYHDNSELVVALSTGWFNERNWCSEREMMIRITTEDGTSTTAKVVDECDSMNGCDKEHAFQLPCRNNIVDGSIAVWKALGLNPDDPDDKGEPSVTWSMA